MGSGIHYDMPVRAYEINVFVIPLIATYIGLLSPTKTWLIARAICLTVIPLILCYFNIGYPTFNMFGGWDVDGNFNRTEALNTGSATTYLTMRNEAFGVPELGTIGVAILILWTLGLAWYYFAKYCMRVIWAFKGNTVMRGGREYSDRLSIVSMITTEGYKQPSVIMILGGAILLGVAAAHIAFTQFFCTQTMNKNFINANGGWDFQYSLIGFILGAIVFPFAYVLVLYLIGRWSGDDSGMSYIKEMMQGDKYTRTERFVRLFGWIGMYWFEMVILFALQLVQINFPTMLSEAILLPMLGIVIILGVISIVSYLMSRGKMAETMPVVEEEMTRGEQVEGQSYFVLAPPV